MPLDPIVLSALITGGAALGSTAMGTFGAPSYEQFLPSAVTSSGVQQRQKELLKYILDEQKRRFQYTTPWAKGMGWDPDQMQALMQQFMGAYPQALQQQLAFKQSAWGGTQQAFDLFKQAGMQYLGQERVAPAVTAIRRGTESAIDQMMANIGQRRTLSAQAMAAGIRAQAQPGIIQTVENVRRQRLEGLRSLFGTMAAVAPSAQFVTPYGIAGV